MEWERIWSIEPIPFSARLMDFASEAIKDVTGVLPPQLPSGPLHDAAEVSRCGIPTVMMFVQSLKGLSHNREEDTRLEHLELAIRAFAGLAAKTLDSIAKDSAV